MGVATEEEHLIEETEEHRAQLRRQYSEQRDLIAQASAQGEASPGARIASLSSMTVEEAKRGIHYMPRPFRALDSSGWPIRSRVLAFATCVTLDVAFTEALTVELRHETRHWSIPLASMRFKEVNLQGKLNVWWDPLGAVLLIALPKYRAPAAPQVVLIAC